MRPSTTASGGPHRPGTDATRGLALALALLAAACSGGDEASTGDASADPDAQLRARLGLDPDRPIHRVTLGGRGASEHVVPARIEIRPGDIVVFVAVDGRVHTVRFPLDSLSARTADFLRRTDQLESPPLLDRDARYVLTFEDAPGGRYPFVSDGGGGSAGGVVVVRDGEN